jgi:iron complex outermembrane recepter protein
MMLALLLLVMVSTVDGGTGGQPDAQDLKQLSIEQLMEIDVTLAARRPEPVGSAAAAVSVITAEDIRRAGVTTIADAIALAEGVHVARFNNGTWAISPRGFNQNTANKLLVMIDGRTVYSPLFTGVFWNTIDYPLPDLDRIEVIRGPGATLWGANAVNGVINIVTRSARDTQGTMVSVTTGNEDPAIVGARYGGGGSDLAWRVYGKYARRDAQRLATGATADDAVDRGQAGFRIDGGAADRTGWMMKGDLFHSRAAFADRPDGEFTDANLQGQWSRGGARSRLQIGAYYRREYRRVPRQLTHHIDIFDVDLQHALARGAHRVVWGAAARVNVDTTHGSNVIRFDPLSRTYPVYSGFVQDELALRPGVALTGGLKVEHNAFSGASLQPNVRARWQVAPRQTLWGSAARAVRRPTRFDDDIVVSAPNGLVLVRGSDDFQPEKLTAYELGYRVQAASLLSVDANVFVHRYDDLRSQEAPVGAPIPLVLGNTLDGRSAGVEIGVNLQPVPRWRTHVGYTRLDTDITREAGSRDVSGGVNEANDPDHFFSLQSSLDIGRNIEADILVRGSGALPNPVVPGYTELNARIGWRPSEPIELAIVGQDLLHDRHPEFGTPGSLREEFERSVRLVIILRLP